MAPFFTTIPLILFVVLCPTQIVTEEIQLGIIQYGDVRGMFEPMLVNGQPQTCSGQGQEICVGGIPLLMSYINDTKNTFLKDTPHFSMATGNLISGENGYLSLFGWSTYGNLLNSIGDTIDPLAQELYRPDFMAMGISEFEAGLVETNDYLRPTMEWTKTIVTNINCTGTTGEESLFCRRTTGHQILRVNGLTIGIVGFVNPLANQLADAGSLFFGDPADAILEELNSSDFEGVDFVIAVGAGNLLYAQSIIDKVDRVKLVLYGGNMADFPGSYPTPYKNSFIATTGSKYGARMGALKLKFDTLTGNLEVEGFLRDVVQDGNILEDSVAVDKFEKLKTEFGALLEVGSSRVNVDGSKCWGEECNLGNLVADSMVHCAYNYKGEGHDPIQLEETLKGPILSLWHGGAFFRFLSPAPDPIHLVDVHKWLPYPNQAYLVKMNGLTLMKLFNTSAEGLGSDSEVRNWGQFLQVSDGVRVIYEDNKVLVRTMQVDESEGVPRFMGIDETKEYDVVIPSTIYKGKSSWSYVTNDLFIELPIQQKYLDLGVDDDCLLKYLKAMGSIFVGLEERSLVQ